MRSGLTARRKDAHAGAAAEHALSQVGAALDQLFVAIQHEESSRGRSLVTSLPSDH